MNNPTPYTALPREIPTVAGVDLVTSGTLQIVVACPNCRGQHRHLGLGLRTGPCGQTYFITEPIPAAKLAAA